MILISSFFRRAFVLAWMVSSLLHPVAVYAGTNSNAINDADANEVFLADERSDTVPIDLEGEEDVHYDGTVIWNGVRFESPYDNTSGNCTAGNVNTQYGILRSYNSNIVTDAVNGSVVGDHIVEYGHGVTNAYSYEGTVMRTHVFANKDYLQFWHGSRTLNKDDCDDNAYCEESFPVNVGNEDAFHKTVGSPFRSGGGKKATVLLRGVKMQYGSSLDNVKKFQDAEFKVWLDSTTLPEDGRITVNVSTNFNGSDTVKYDIVVYYVILAYDPGAVSVTNFEANPANLNCDSEHFCSHTQEVTLAGVVPDSTIQSNTVESGGIVPMFVGLKSWGFDMSSDVHKEIHRIRSGARLKDFHSVPDKKANVQEFGEAFRDDCNVTSDGSQHWKTNELTYRVISCRDTSVCQASYSYENFSHEAWLQKTWNAIKDGFETVFEAIEDAVEEIVEVVEDVVEEVGDIVNDVLFPNADEFPENEVLVVLRDGETEEALTSPANNGTIERVYRQHGTPTVEREFPAYEDQEQVDSYVEAVIMQPYDVRGILRSFGQDPNIDIPPLHRFYVLTFPGIGEDERDDIIGELSAAPKIDQVSANYVAKLNAPPGDDLYASSFVWFQPYLQMLWPEFNDVVSYSILLFMNPEEIHEGMDLLYPIDVSAYSRTQQFAVDPAKATTHFQFPGRAAYPKDVCDSFVARPVSRLEQTQQSSRMTVSSGTAAGPLRKAANKIVASGSALGLTIPKTTLLNQVTPTMVVTAMKNLGKSLQAKTVKKAISTKNRSGSNQTSSARAAAPIAPPNRGRTDCADGEILVKYASGTTAAQRRDVEVDLGLTKIKHFVLSDSYYYTLNPGAGVYDTLERLQDRSEVSYAEPNAAFEFNLVPNDPDYSTGASWHLYSWANPANVNRQGINGPGAWDRSVGNRSIIVAVIDSGNKPFHPDYFSMLGQNSYYNAAEDQDVYEDADGDECGDRCCYVTGAFSECRDLDGDSYAGNIVGWNFWDNNPVVEDTYGHGTAMSGIIGAVGRNGLNTTGVSWEVTILPLKVSTARQMFASEVIQAIDYAVDHGARVVNMSFGSYNADNLVDGARDVQTAIRTASSVLFVAAADNQRVDHDLAPYYPASFSEENIIAVGASDKDGRIWRHSGWGMQNIDILAPGVDINSLNIYDGSGNAGSGTSAATAIVSGTAALMAAACPGVTPAQIKAVIIRTAHRSVANQSEVVAGGVLDAKEAVEECMHLNDNDASNDVTSDDQCEAQQQICFNSAESASTQAACESIPMGSWVACADPADVGNGLCNRCGCEPCATGSYSMAPCSPRKRVKPRHDVTANKRSLPPRTPCRKPLSSRVPPG